MTPGKFDELQCILKAIPTTTHLILLTETWIQSESDAKLQQLTGYTHYYNFRDDSRGGGVSIFIHNSLDHKLTEEKYTDGNHFLWILLKKISLNIESAMSDHKHIYLELIKRIPTNKEKIKYDAVDYDKLYKCIKELDLKSEHHNYSNLEQNIKMCIKESTITKTKRVNLPKDDWINKDIIAGINTRNTYWRKLKKDPKNKNKLNDFIRERNRVTININKTKKTYYYGAFEKCGAFHLLWIRH
ncbi:Uncharacterized protein OBRU01_19586 [Operophtera brumata]|uniref:Uncharacterized protein n=1 Tax=Operophtera brumata TaxID=104452 RepID=A0A0L7KMH5_OPEBR|nr:Uncharacterized protein OBRU01_19586 [Operophtera brumata]